VDSLQVTLRIDECLFFELEDHLFQFDAIIDSIMDADLQRNQIREALSDWCASVTDQIEEITQIKHSQIEEPTLTADEVFGTEV
jgi:hypothetical protein